MVGIDGLGSWLAFGLGRSSIEWQGFQVLIYYGLVHSWADVGLGAGDGPAIVSLLESNDLVALVDLLVLEDALALPQVDA